MDHSPYDSAPGPRIRLSPPSTPLRSLRANRHLLSPTKLTRVSDDSQPTLASIINDDGLAISQKDLAVRVAHAAKRIHEWHDELDRWRWTGSFDVNEKDVEELQSITDNPELDTTHQGSNELFDQFVSLSGKQLSQYEEQLDAIHDEYSQLEVEELKQRILELNVDRSRLSSLGSTTTKSGLSFLNDFSFFVTQTLIRALPELSNLNPKLKIWTTRLIVMRQIPRFLHNYTVATEQMSNAWKSLEVDNQRQALNAREDYIHEEQIRLDGIKGRCHICIAAAASVLDAMLDGLEGQEDKLPDRWIEAFEAVEADFAHWCAAAHRKLFEAQYAVSPHSPKTENPKLQGIVPEPQSPMDEFVSTHTKQSSARSEQATSSELCNLPVTINQHDDNGAQTVLIAPGLRTLEVALPSEDATEALSSKFGLNVATDASIANSVQEDPIAKNLGTVHNAYFGKEKSLVEHDQDTLKSQHEPSHIVILDQGMALHPDHVVVKVDARPTYEHQCPESKTSSTQDRSSMANTGFPSSPDPDGSRLLSLEPLRAGDSSTPSTNKAEQETLPVLAHDQETLLHESATPSACAREIFNVIHEPDAMKRLSDDSEQSFRFLEQSLLGNSVFSEPTTSDDITDLTDSLEPGASGRSNYLDRPHTPDMFTDYDDQMFLEDMSKLSVLVESDDDHFESDIEESPSQRKVLVSKAPKPPLNAMMKKRTLRDEGVRVSALKLHQNIASAHHTPDKTESLQLSPVSPVMPLELQISNILEAIPTRIRFRSGPKASAPEVKRPRARASSNNQSRRSSVSRSATPSLTLAPADEPSKRNTTNVSDIRLYHLIQAGQEKPIKLFIRRVGENGERVMVRVGGGWADLAEYLRIYAEHHGRRAVSEGRIEIQALNTGKTPPKPGNRRSSLLGSANRSMTPTFGRSMTPTTGERSRSNTPAFSEKAQQADFTGTPRITVDTPQSIPSASSRRSAGWNEVGMAGPRTRRGEMSEEKKDWVEGIIEQTKRGMGKDTEVGDLGISGSTRRIFFKGRKSSGFDKT